LRAHAANLSVAAGDPGAEPAIRVANLRKRYGGHEAVAGVSFTVERGEVFALLGPNGAGKTTTIEILEGYRGRDGGEVEVLGLDPARDAGKLRRRVGLMLQEGGIYPQARPPEILRLFAQFYAQAEDPEALLRLVGLEDARRTSYRRLSGGQKQRLALALALVGRPELVFLDEPTAGMDPQARRATLEIVRALRGRGVTIFLTTHYMEEAEQLADSIGILDRGRLVALGPLEALGSDDAAVRLVTAAEVDLVDLRRLPGVGVAHRDQPRVYRLEATDPQALLVTLTGWARSRGVPIRELRVGGESLEEIFLRLTDGEAVE
jgi:ABC-2 type transport system ATP-binding protein